MKQRKKDCVRSSKNIDEKEKEKNTGNRGALCVTYKRNKYWVTAFRIIWEFKIP